MRGFWLPLPASWPGTPFAPCWYRTRLRRSIPHLRIEIWGTRQMRGFFPFGKLRVRMTIFTHPSEAWMGHPLRMTTQKGGGGARAAIRRRG